MSKYIELSPQIMAHESWITDSTEVNATLDWLDENPDQVPGRTITEGDLIAAVDETNHEDMNEYQKARALLVHLGYTIPEPEPTNADKLAEILRSIHDQASPEYVAESLDELGVVAPGGDDE